jgi:hypothetical protein
MAYFQGPMGAGYQESQRDILLLNYMMNEYLINSKSNRILSVHSKYSGKLLDAVMAFQKKYGIREEKAGLIKNNSPTFIKLHTLLHESPNADKSWEMIGDKSVETLRKKIREQIDWADTLRGHENKTKREQDSALEIRKAIDTMGGLDTFRALCIRAGVSLNFAFKWITSLNHALDPGAGGKISWWAKFMKSLSFHKLMALLKTPISFQSFINAVKNLKGWSGVFAAIIVVINAGYYFSKGEYKKGITEVTALLYSIVVWPAALGDLIEVILERVEWIKNSVFWRFVKNLNPSRHIKVLVQCFLTVVHCGMCAIAGDKGGTNAALTDLLKWFESDEALKQLNAAANDPITFVKDLLIEIGQALCYFADLLYERFIAQQQFRLVIA